MKPVGKPDAGNPHVRFDERGRETGWAQCCQQPAPVLDSTCLQAEQRSACGSQTVPQGYNTFLRELKQRIRQAQIWTALAVNRELIVLYWPPRPAFKIIT